MNREDRYLVLKVTDIETAAFLQLITPEIIDALDIAANAVKAVRQLRGKDELSCVVVESDWPEYEPVWGMIEARVDGVTNQ